MCHLMLMLFWISKYNTTRVSLSMKEVCKMVWLPIVEHNLQDDTHKKSLQLMLASFSASPNVTSYSSVLNEKHLEAGLWECITIYQDKWEWVWPILSLWKIYYMLKKLLIFVYELNTFTRLKLMTNTWRDFPKFDDVFRKRIKCGNYKALTIIKN